MGRIMNATSGNGNPQVVRPLLVAKLEAMKN